MTKTSYVIHVNRQVIAFNAKHGKPVLPPYIVRRGSRPSVYGFGVEITGKTTLVDPRRHKPLKCGARAWISTEGPVKIIDPMSFREVEALRKKHESA